MEVDVAHDLIATSVLPKGEKGGNGDDGLGNTTTAANTTTTNNSNVDKGKKKGLPAKNPKIERRKRKKLNDRLYMFILEHSL